MNFNKFIEKLRSLPEGNRKVILWAIVIILGLIFLVFWLNGVRERFKNFESGGFLNNIGVPKLQEEIGSFPKIEFPEITVPELTEEELKKLNDAIGDTGNTENGTENIIQ
ncbi:MAG: hypothetical protein US98_C0003G0003 [Parcubacteria group bacterium GW2011_GWC1_38_6]|nr:MAG: hypothetical protein US98_C0003G0003 [Parcubacteria group bacterium GW2011_GWC1_38_6]